MILASLSKRLAALCLVSVACFAATGGFQQASAMDPLGGLGNLIGGVTRDITGGSLGTQVGIGASLSGASGLGGLVPNVLNSANNIVSEVTRPVMGVLGSLGAGAGGAAGFGGFSSGGNVVNDAMRVTTGAISGLTTGATAGLGLGGFGGSALAGSNLFGLGPSGGLHNAFKREAVASSLAGAAAAAGMQDVTAGATAANSIEMGARYGQAAAAAETAGMMGAGMMGAGMMGAGMGAGFGPMAQGAAVAAAAGAVAGAAPMAAAVGAAEGAAAINNVATAAAASQGASQVLGRAALAGEAMRNAQAESAIAGADMVAHGANNARSASLASNAYRQAKLASARDRVNIAGTIQNSARISDAAIATHDAATKAEDSLLGSELAVDSASTVLDSDGAYIPPVTSSLLRSLPYGRLGVRNIVPKPLTYPSVLLPDVWLNGVPVNYQNVPLRMLPYTIGSTAATNQLWQSGAALAHGQIINGQPFIANNGMLLNGMVVDPAVAYMLSGSSLIGNMAASSIMPILANGQLEAQDEVAAANLLTMHQLGGAGMSATYQGYGRLNPVPMITGSVSDVNLMPTTTIGTTYPIGSALVIEPRDSYFQDYVDNASSRQNFDEHQQ